MGVRMLVALSLALLSAWGSGAQDTREAPATPVTGHHGPAVAPGDTATARFAGELYDEFAPDAAMATVRFVDGFYRAPGNVGYDASLDYVRERLAAVGFGEREGFELDEIRTPLRSAAWTPVSGSFEVKAPGGEWEQLHGFDAPGDPDRVMLPINAPSADVEGVLVLDAEGVTAGSVFVGEASLGGRAVAAHVKRGAVAVVSASIADFTRDPSGGDAHLDAIQFRSVSRSVGAPVAQISPRSLARLRALAAEHEGVRVRLRSQVTWKETGELRTLVARVTGATRPTEAVVVASHVQEPGAGDNASGVGGLCEGATALARAIRKGALDRPARTLVFLWGDEMRQSAIWLNATERTVIAGISADMLGQSRDATGARCLLERAPDPGALDTLPPDEHTPWGAGPVKEEDLVPSGLSLIARSALVDVARHVGGWHTSENPWEGGSDHDVFLRAGVPGILIWHFTDFTYHTGLDRLERLDSEELRRTSSAVLATALCLADLRDADLERLRASNALELELRVAAALEAERPDVAKRWREWCRGVELWLAASVVDSEGD